MRLIACLLCFFILGAVGKAQLLIDVGYTPSYYQHGGLDQAIDQFNTNTTWLSRQVNKPRLLHGVHMRLKHRFVEVAPYFEMNYQVNSLSFDGTRPGDATKTDGQLRTNYLSYGGGLEWEKNAFGIGAGIGNQSFGLRLKEEGGSQEIDDKILDQNSLFCTLYFNLLPSVDVNNITNLVIQPFYIFPLKTIDTSELTEYLDVDSLPAEGLWQVGIRIILSNGQR